jgi:hypothetical protein
LILLGLLSENIQLLMQRNGQKRDKKVEGEKRQEKVFFSSTSGLFGKKFLTWTWTSPNFFWWCF